MKARHRQSVLGRLMGPPKDSPGPEQPLIAHLIELRSRLLRAAIAVGVIFLCLLPFARELYTALAQPLLATMPVGSTMIATEVASPFLIPFKFTFVLAVFLAMPYMFLQVWTFIAPGLYKREKKVTFPLMVSSVVLFYGGMAFAYFVVFPLAFSFLTGTAPEGVAVMTDISSYLDFVLKMFFAFGLAFEVPVATVLLVLSGVATPQSLAEKRRYVIVGAFVFGMIFTPPDVLSQCLLAIPMWLLFEVGLVVSRLVTQPVEAEAEAQITPDEESQPK